MKSLLRSRVGWLAKEGLGAALVVVMLGWMGEGRASAQTAPKLVSSAPAHNATAVAVTSRTVTFVFDLAMLPNDALGGVPGFFTGAVKWSENLSEEFEYGWSEDAKTLVCTYSSDFPPNATLTWALNPPDVFAGLNLQSATGVSLAKGTYSGSFQTGAADGGGGGGGGGGEVGVPVLVSTTPAKGATAVALDAKVIFVFDQPMTPNPQIGGVPPFVKGAIAWTGAGLSANKFSYAWSADGKTLTCTYTGSLPGSATIGWELNPADALFTLDSAEGDPLPSGLYQGSFTTAAGGGPDPVDCNASEIPDSWGSYSMNKGAAYQQTSAADPVPGLNNPFTAGAFISSGQGGAAVTAGSLTFPGGAVKTLEGLFGTFFVGDDYATEAAMEAAYPPGAYTLKFTRTGEAERSIAMTVPANTIPVPKIANYVEAQSIDPAQPFTLRWNAFTGASNPHDFLHLTIMDGTKVLFQAPDLCVPRELAVTATSIAIPAGTFQLGKTYNATLSFSREFYYSTNAVPNMGGFASLGRTTDFSLTATGGVTPAAPARFVEFRRLPNGHPQMVLTGTPSRGYTLERAGNLSAPVWRDAGTVTLDAAGRGSFEDAQAGTLFPLFYRARAN